MRGILQVLAAVDGKQRVLFNSEEFADVVDWAAKSKLSEHLDRCQTPDHCSTSDAKEICSRMISITHESVLEADPRSPRKRLLSNLHSNFPRTKL